MSSALYIFLFYTPIHTHTRCSLSLLIVVCKHFDWNNANKACSTNAAINSELMHRSGADWLAWARSHTSLSNGNRAPALLPTLHCEVQWTIPPRPRANERTSRHMLVTDSQAANTAQHTSKQWPTWCTGSRVKSGPVVEKVDTETALLICKWMTHSSTMIPCEGL
jgi:hypothetical protein